MFPLSCQLKVSFLLLLMAIISGGHALLPIQARAQTRPVLPLRNSPRLIVVDGTATPPAGNTPSTNQSKAPTNRGNTKRGNTKPEQFYTIEDGYKLYKSHEYEAAVKVFQEILSQNPNETEVRLFLGKSFYVLGNEINKVAQKTNKKEDLKRSQDYYNDAINAFKKVVDVQPNDAEAQFNLGKAYYNLKDWEAARVEYEKTVDLIPDNSEAQFFLGKTYFWLKKYKRAIELYELAGKLGYNTEERLYNLGRAYLRVDLEDYMNPGNELNAIRQTNLCQAEKQYQELKKLNTQAADDFVRDLRINIDSFKARNKLMEPCPTGKR